MSDGWTASQGAVKSAQAGRQVLAGDSGWRDGFNKIGAWLTVDWGWPFG
jgi:hypothetical protein